MSLSVCVLASGSAGNCVVVVDGADTIVVDCGISAKRALARLDAVGISPSSIRGIVLTHEHSDHSGGVGVLSRKLDVPVYSTSQTLAACARALKTLAGQVLVSERRPFTIGSTRFEPFPTFHDAANPFALVVRSSGPSSPALGIVTDLGFVSTLAFERLRGVRTAVFEANHDRAMLLKGPYPWDLKQRILGTRGHLDNVASARALARLWGDGLRQVLLAHLSETNNTPEIVLATLARELPSAVHESSRFVLTHQEEVTEVLTV